MMGDAGVPNESLAGSLFVEVTSLVEQELFSSAVTLGQYMVASAGGASAPPSCKALLADALFGAREWRRDRQPRRGQLHHHAGPPPGWAGPAASAAAGAAEQSLNRGADQRQ